MQVSECARQIRTLLEERSLSPGARLPPERELVSVIGASRGTLRKALSTLEREGLIWRHVGQGTFVGRPPPRNGSAAALSFLPSLGSLQRVTSPAEVMEVRLLLEPGIAAVAALRATGADMEELRTCIEEGEEASDVAAFEKWDGQFHQVIVRAARNAFLATIFETINEARKGELWGRLKSASVTPDRRISYLGDHSRILAAIMDRDSASAQAAMQAHLQAVRRDLLGD